MQYYIASCIRVPPWFECILLVGLSHHCLIRGPSCPDTCSYRTGPDFPWTVQIYIVLFSIVPQNSVWETRFFFFGVMKISLL